MGKTITLLVALLMFAACSRLQDSSELREKEREALEKIVSDYNDDDSDIEAEYDEKKQCIKLSWKCETLTASYDLHFRDLLSEKPTSYADGFRISMVLFYKGVTKIDMLEFNYEGIKFKVFPFVSEKIDDKGIAMAGFHASDDSSVECFKMLSNLSGLVTGKIHTNKGPIDIPLKDVFNLRGMARSYVIDGGKFEK